MTDHTAIARLRTPARALFAVALLAGLAACSNDTLNLRKELGLVTEGPDEFSVVKRRPLELPPSQPSNVDDLPVPQPGAPSPLDPNPVAEARQALTGGVDQSAAGAASASEQSLLRQAGAEGANDSIREELEQEADNELAGTMVDEAVQEVVEAVTGSRPDAPAEDPLDPAAEARRLAEQARDSGRNPNLEVAPAADAD